MAEKMTSCRFSRWRLAAILDFGDQIMGSLKSPIKLTKLLSFPENRVFAFLRQDPRWRISVILDFMGPIMGSLKSPCTTSYRLSIEIIALNCLVFEKIMILRFGDRQTDKQMDTTDALSCSCCHEWWLNKTFSATDQTLITNTFTTYLRNSYF